jgi:hypothetical protein
MKILFAFLLLSLTVSMTAQRDTLTAVGQSNIVKNDYHKILKSQFDFSLATSAIKPFSTISFAFPNPCMSGMFCKMEYRIEKISAIAPRFRLGSVGYANWMEGKGDFYSRYW